MDATSKTIRYITLAGYMCICDGGQTDVPSAWWKEEPTEGGGRDP